MDIVRSVRHLARFNLPHCTSNALLDAHHVRPSEAFLATALQQLCEVSRGGVFSTAGIVLYLTGVLRGPSALPTLS